MEQKIRILKGNLLIGAVVALMLLVAMLSSCSCEMEVDPSMKAVVISIDDMPAFPENTAKMLDVLEENDAKATLFCVGKQMIEHPNLIDRMLEEGHTLANHSYTHMKLSEVDIQDVVDNEILKTQELIDSFIIAHDKELNEYFRPPYGALNDDQTEYLSYLGFEVLWWDIDASDWNPEIRSDEVYTYIMERIGNYEIPVILFHLGTNSIEGLDMVLKELKRRNIEVISFEERKLRLSK